MENVETISLSLTLTWSKQAFEAWSNHRDALRCLYLLYVFWEVQISFETRASFCCIRLCKSSKKVWIDFKLLLTSIHSPLGDIQVLSTPKGTFTCLASPCLDGLERGGARHGVVKDMGARDAREWFGEMGGSKSCRHTTFFCSFVLPLNLL